MKNQQEVVNAKMLLIDTYKRLRSGDISREQAKCESELLTNIIKTVEMSDLKEQIKYLNNLLTSNKKEYDKQ